MNLLALLTTALLISVCIALPPIDYDGPQEDSKQTRNGRRNRFGSSFSRACSRMFSCAPGIDFRQHWDAEVGQLSNFAPSDDRAMASTSTMPESRLMDDDGTQLNDQPNYEIVSVPLPNHGNKNVDNLVSSTKASTDASTDIIIRNIRRLCAVTGQQVHPMLRLTRLPTAQCAESIIASNGNFHIRSLTMVLVPMTLDGAHSIASIVKRTTLFDLNLSQCMLTGEMIVIITASFPHSMLTSLGLGNSPIDAVGVGAIAAVLPQSMLTQLNLAWCNIGDEGARTIGRALPESKLTSLDLGGNSIGDVGATEIAVALSDSKLSSLDLASNNIGHEGAIAIGENLSLSMLASLDLSHNRIGDEGVRAISVALRQSMLTLLGLEDNHIGDEGARAIGGALPESMLTSLDLYDNRIGSEGASAISVGLYYSKLKSLVLSNNKIGDEGAIEIANAPPDSMLMTLDLSYNDMTSLCVQELRDLLPLIPRDNFRLKITQRN